MSEMEEQKYPLKLGIHQRVIYRLGPNHGPICVGLLDGFIITKLVAWY